MTRTSSSLCGLQSRRFEKKKQKKNSDCLSRFFFLCFFFSSTVFSSSSLCLPPLSSFPACSIFSSVSFQRVNQRTQNSPESNRFDENVMKTFAALSRRGVSLGGRPPSRARGAESHVPRGLERGLGCVYGFASRGRLLGGNDSDALVCERAERKVR